MTRPSVVFFGFDTVPRETAKVFLRCLLYSTAVRGNVVESMFAKIRVGGSERVFAFWGYGEANKLSPGSGLFVGQTGVSLNHHFVLSVHETPYVFLAGRYAVEIFAHPVGAKAPKQLMALTISLTEAQAASLRAGEGILFELDPVTGVYLGHSRSREPPALLDIDAPAAE